MNREVNDMKKIVLISILSGFVSLCAFAQDDMYFIPKKVDKAEQRQEIDIPVGYVGNAPLRDVDEYNRRGQFASQYFMLDSAAAYNDVIDFTVDTAYVAGNDSLLMYDDDFDYAYNPEDDYVYSRRMSRYDDFYWYDPWYYGWYGYGPYWYGRPYWYAGVWYDPWYDPWFYGWSRPWGWYYPSHWHVAYRPYRGVTGTSNHSRPGVNRNNGARYNRVSRFNRNQNSVNRRFPDNNNVNRQNSNRSSFGGNRNSFSRPSGTSSFGGNRSGGGFRGGSFGGGRSGGGRFGGRR